MKTVWFLILIAYSCASFSREPCSTIQACAKSFREATTNQMIFTENTLGKAGVVSVKLNEFFEIEKIEVVESSGNEDFDAAMVAAVTRASPFHEFKGLSEKDAVKIRDMRINFSSPTKEQMEQMMKKRNKKANIAPPEKRAARHSY